MASNEDWTAQKCEPCEGGVAPIGREDAEEFVGDLDDWTLSPAADSIERSLNRGDFMNAVSMINRIAELAEAEAHHPDLHLTGYRHLRIVLTTHAIGGLSRNDFIVAAKIDQLLSNKA